MWPSAPDAGTERDVQEALLRIYRHDGFRQFISFVLTGILNTAFGYAVFALTYLASGSSPFSVAVATVVGATFNYFSYGKLVFNNVGYGALLRFVTGYAAIGVLNILLLEVASTAISQTLIAQLVLLPALVAAAFVLNKFWVFRR